MKNLVKVCCLFCLAVVALVGCGNDGGDKLVIGISMNAADEYCTALLNSMTKEAEKLGYEVISTNANGSANKQISDVESLVVKNPDVIIMRAVDPGASSPAADAAMKAGIKLLIVDLPIFEADYNVRLTSEQGRVGELVGDYINNWLAEDSSRVANVGYVKGNDIPPTAPRREMLFATSPKAKELVTMTTTPEWSAASAQSIVNDWLTAYTDMNIIAAMSDELALGAVQALKTANKNLADYLVFGCDGTKNGLLAVKNGEMAATVITDPIPWGQKAITIANDLVNGKEYELKTDVDGTDAMVIVTKDNVADFLSE